MKTKIKNVLFITIMILMSSCQNKNKSYEDFKSNIERKIIYKLVLNHQDTTGFFDSLYHSIEKKDNSFFLKYIYGNFPKKLITCVDENFPKSLNIEDGQELNELLLLDYFDNFLENAYFCSEIKQECNQSLIVRPIPIKQNLKINEKNELYLNIALDMECQKKPYVLLDKEDWFEVSSDTMYFDCNIDYFKLDFLTKKIGEHQLKGWAYIYNYNYKEYLAYPFSVGYNIKTKTDF